MSDVVLALRKVPFLAHVDDAALGDLAKRAGVRRYVKGARIVSELESGADVFVIVKGRAEVSVDARAGERRVLGELDAGSAFGEMSSLTGELRSATITATTDVEALVIADADFDRLREERPQVALALVRILASRIAEAERALEELFAGRQTAVPGVAKTAQGSIARAWRELVIGRRRDLAFLTLSGFGVSLLAIRAIVFAAFRFDFAPREILRDAYVTGFMLLMVSACAALLTFRPAWRRAIALAYGVGLALILNELGVTLAFDIFFKDIHTPDPNVAFDVETLYRRTEALRAIALGFVVLVQAAYLRGFYRRVLFILGTRLRRVFARGR
jgi:CRP-like cAMP-binding protein